MRPKKDPGIRREQFIDAATGLFLQHGYEGFSIKSVLNAVGDRSISPSVFYYYFASKDELYRAAVEGIANSYVDDFKKVFANDSLSLYEQFLKLVEVMHKSLIANRMLISTDISDKNRSFILDMKEQVTASFTEMWEQFILRFGFLRNQEPRRPALFISGGISAMIMEYMMQGVRNEQTEITLVKEIIIFSASILGFHDTEKEMLIQSIEHGKAE